VTSEHNTTRILQRSARAEFSEKKKLAGEDPLDPLPVEKLMGKVNSCPRAIIDTSKNVHAWDGHEFQAYINRRMASRAMRVESRLFLMICNPALR
jgi:hypothetical protein